MVERTTAAKHWVPAWCLLFPDGTLWAWEGGKNYWDQWNRREIMCKIFRFPSSVLGTYRVTVDLGRISS